MTPQTHQDQSMQGQDNPQHPGNRPEPQQPANEPEPSQPGYPVDPWQREPQRSQGEDPTGPVWYGQTQPLQREHAAFGPGASQGQPGEPGQPQAEATGAPYGEHAAYPNASQPPAGPPPAATTQGGAGHAQPGNRRRWAELSAVAVIAAILASGGTYAATQLDDGAQASSTASTSSLGRGTGQGPVVQADAQNPNWTSTAAAVSPSVVSITVRAGNSGDQGSGVIIDDKGHVLTNNHVVAGAGQGATITVTLNNGRTYPASVAGTDPATDLAVITLKTPPSDLKPIAFGNSDSLKVGDPVMAIGNPLGLAGTVTTGIVSALNRPVTTQAEQQQQSPDNPFGLPDPSQGGSDAQVVVTNAIQTSAAINPGNSGGALVNASGQLVGINSSIASLGQGSGQSGSIGIGFAIPVNEAKAIATQLIEKGSAQHAFLGVSLKDGVAADGNSQRAGAQVTDVVANTPASRAGLKTGDVVIAVDDVPIDSSLALVANVHMHQVGDKVSLTVLRDGKQVKLDSTLVAKPSTSS
jgi:putative serine protease PepD